ncbi:promotilin [Nothoprocta perdicaria]|uniref:promotilin n=1 Tax=Nothoprocta perdicaria TaxID=30464 RepID=UPI000E1B6976|nr:promotilin [Nothoprocta perdicaria]
MVSKKALAPLLVVYVVAVLAEQTESFLPFFTQSNPWRMQHEERNKGQKKSLTLMQHLEEEGSSKQPRAEDVKTLQLAIPAKAGMRLTSRQLEKYQDVLEKLLAEMLQDTPDGEELRRRKQYIKPSKD